MKIDRAESAIIGFLIGLVIGAWMATSTIQSQAIKAGAAEWTINPQTGEKAFRWLPKHHPQ